MVSSPLLYFISVPLFAFFTEHTSWAAKSRLVIGGLAGLNVQGNGWCSAGIVPAVELALERVNNHSDILKDYHLDIEWKDAKCASGFGIKGMVEHITEKPLKIAFLGPGCSVAADPVAETLPFWNLTQISFSLTSPALSNKKKYPNLYRVNPSETIHDPALLALADLFKWQRLFIIKHELALFNSMTEPLRGLLMANKKLVYVIGYLHNTTSVIEFLQKRNARILFLFMYEKQAREIFCSVYKSGFHGSHVVWIVHGWYSKGWWRVKDTQCTLEEIEKVMTNVISADHVDYGSDPQVEVLGLTKPGFIDKYKQFIREDNKKNSEVQKYAPYGYDAIVMLARALNATEENLRRRNQSLREFTYARSDITKIIKEKISKTDHVTGLTGDITLDRQGDRITNVWIQQLQNFTMVNVALYLTENNSIKMWRSENFKWKDGKVPPDRRPRTEILLCVCRSTFWWTSGASICGVFVALYFLWFNIKNSSQRFFKMSTPPLNNIMIFGAIMAYIYVPVHGIKQCKMEVTVINSSLCKVDSFVISIAFSLVFGAIFMKTWRIYKIFTNAKLSKQLKFLTNKHLTIMVILLVMFDLVYLIVWNAIHPLQDSIETVLTEKNHAVNKVYLAHQCTSPHYWEWIAGVISYKGLLMIFGMFLTWETRNVSFPGLNESKYIGICVYNIFIICTAVLPVGWFALPTNVDAAHVIIATSIVFCATTTLGLMFMPKIHPEKKLGTASTHPTMSLDKTVVDFTPNTITGQCATCKNSHL